MASISSKMMTCSSAASPLRCWSASASSNSFRTFSSLAPTYLQNSMAICEAMKLALSAELSGARWAHTQASLCTGCKRSRCKATGSSECTQHCQQWMHHRTLSSAGHFSSHLHAWKQWARSTAGYRPEGQPAGLAAHLFSISGPLTTLGSLPFSILPIWRAIRVLPVPGGPKSSTPCRHGQQPVASYKCKTKAGRHSRTQHSLRHEHAGASLGMLGRPVRQHTL